MNKKLAQKAVKAALSGDWEQAIELNKELLNETPEDVDAMNRLANALAASGNIKEAKEKATKVLEIEDDNAIAKRSLEKWNNIKDGDQVSKEPVNASEFIEESGKTKIIPLINLGDSSVLKLIMPADKVLIMPHNHKVCVYTKDEKYIGRLPDDIAASLKTMIELGNEYNSYIKSVSNNEVTLFVREVKRCEKLKNFPSFSSDKVNYFALKDNSS